VRRETDRAVVLLFVSAVMLFFPSDVASAAEKGKCDTVFVMDAFCEAGKSVARATGDVVTAPIRYAADSAVDTVTTWVADTAHWLLGKVLNFINTSTSPDLGAEWFLERYEFMIGLGALVVLPMLLIASVRAIITQDLSQLLRSFFLYLPTAVIGTFVAVAFTNMLLVVTDGLSSAVANGIGNDAGRIFDSVGEALGVSGIAQPTLPSFAIFVGALLVVVGSFFVWLELLIRSAAVTVAAFFLPLILATLVWPATARWTRRLIETLVALILSKFVIVAVISLATAALAEPAGGGFGAVMGGAALMLMAALSPFVLLRLMPAAEGAAISQLEGLGRRPINTIRPGGSVHQVTSMMKKKVGGAGAAPLAAAGGGAAVAGMASRSRSASGAAPSKTPIDVAKSSSRGRETMGQDSGASGPAKLSPSATPSRKQSPRPNGKHTRSDG